MRSRTPRFGPTRARTHRLPEVWLVLAAVALTGLVQVPASAQASPTQAHEFRDEFEGAADAGWSFRDGYADQFPSDTANHATFATGAEHLSISFPGGAGHNQWLLRHAEAMRPYGGSGVYEVKVDSAFQGFEQFGLAFESSPGSFMHFMLYAEGGINAYVERFTNVGGTQSRATVAGAATGLSVPRSGPWYLRVTVADDDEPQDRTWRFQWSIDGASWTTVVDGVFESADPAEDVGAIQTVGVFAGNQPSGFSAYDAQVDYFYSGAQPPPVPVAAPVLTVRAGDGVADASWTEVSTAETYNVYLADHVSGAATLVASTVVPAHSLTGLTNGEDYFVSVAAVAGGVEGTRSAVVRVVPEPPVLVGVPSDGLVIGLTAASLASSHANGDLVGLWPDGAGGPASASASGSGRPTFVTSGIGGQPSVRFDGVDDHFSMPAGFEDFTSGVTMFVVTRPEVLQSGMKFVALGNGPGSANVVLGRAGGANGLQYFTTNASGGYGWFNTGSGLVGGSSEATIISVSQPGGTAGASVTATVKVGGATVGSGSVFVPPVTTRSVNYVGRSFWNEGWFQGEIAAVLVYDRELSAQEEADVQSHLSATYGGAG